LAILRSRKITSLHQFHKVFCQTRLVPPTPALGKKVKLETRSTFFWKYLKRCSRIHCFKLHMKDYTKTVRSFYFLPFLTRPLPRTPSIISVEAVRSPTLLAVVAIHSRGRPLPGDAYSPLRLSTPLALSACCRGYLLIVVAPLAAMAVRSHGRPLPRDARCRGHPLPHTVYLSSRPPAPRCCAAPRGR
jgi:hypothetical protein